MLTRADLVHDMAETLKKGSVFVATKMGIRPSQEQLHLEQKISKPVPSKQQSKSRRTSIAPDVEEEERFSIFEEGEEDFEQINIKNNDNDEIMTDDGANIGIIP